MKKRILLAEILYPEGHKTSNEARIKVLSSIADIILVDDGSYYSEMTIPSNVKRVFVKHSLPDKDKFDRVKKIIPFLKYTPFEFLAYLCYLFKIFIKTLFERYDYVFFLSSRTDALYIGRLFFKKPIIVVHHNDIDRLYKKAIEMKLFQKYKNKIFRPASA